MIWENIGFKMRPGAPTRPSNIPVRVTDKYQNWELMNDATMKYLTHSGMIKFRELVTFKQASFQLMVSIASMFTINVSASPVNDMSILGLGQRAPTRIFLSPTIPPHDMVCPKSSTTPTHGHVYTYNIYMFVCLTAMNMKYLLHTICTE